MTNVFEIGVERHEHERKKPDMVVVTKEDAENYCRLLTILGMEEEGSPVEEVERLIALREGMTCADCNGTGWLEHRVEGKFPCACMTEAEPYQLLQAKVAGLTQERDKFESALYGADEMAAACDYLVKNNLIDARSALADARLIYGTPYKYKSRITRAEAVIEKASEALEWAKCYCSKAIHKVQVQPAALEALAAITEYREGK